MNKSQTFTASDTFTVPSGVSLIFITSVASGGGGGAGGPSVNHDGAESGASGEWCVRRPLHVTPGGSISISIGSGGAGISNPSSQAGKGADTVVGPFLLEGGYGGQGATTFNVDYLSKGGGFNGYLPLINNTGLNGVAGARESRSGWGGSGPGGRQQAIGVPGSPGRTGGPCGCSFGGTPGVEAIPDFEGGGAGGASSYFGLGGTGADGRVSAGNATNYGTGGGGGGGCGNGSGAAQTSGGYGMSGLVILDWIEP